MVCFETKNIRQSGVELLRILAAMAVIVLHIRGDWETTVNPNSTNYYVYWIIENLCAAAVNCFLIITGYFSVNKKEISYWKPFELYMQLVICRELIYGVMVIIGSRPLTAYEIFIKLFPTNYYVTLYIGLILLAPYINKLISVLDDIAFKRMIIILMILISVWPTIVDILIDLGGMSLVGANTIGVEGGSFGETLIHFIFMYILGSSLRRYEPIIKTVILFFMIIASNAFLTIMCFLYLYNGIKVNRILTYSNPLLIIEASALFLLFKKIILRSKVINILASGSFMTYLLHGYFLKVVSIKNIVNENILYVLTRTLAILIGVYLVCFICSIIYDRTVSAVLLKRIKLYFKDK